MENQESIISEEKKNLTEEELDKVSGGWTAKDTAKHDALTKLWDRVMILVDRSLKKQKPLEIQLLYKRPKNCMMQL